MNIFPFVFLLLVNSSCAYDTIVPVLVLDYENLMQSHTIHTNPLQLITPSLFVEIIHDSIKKSEYLVVFVEETFCPEDISTKDDRGTPYPFLHKGLKEKKLLYVPSVLNPFNFLNQIFQPHDNNRVYINNLTDVSHVFDRNVKYVYVFFNDTRNETRTATLRRHDAIIREVLLVARAKHLKSVLAFYTGKTNPMDVNSDIFLRNVGKRIQSDPGATMPSPGALIHLRGVHASTPTRRVAFAHSPLLKEETYESENTQTKISFNNFDLRFNFTLGATGWVLDTIGLMECGKEVGFTKMGVGAPWGRCYVCADPIKIFNKKNGTYVTISHYQVQAFTPSMRRKGRRQGTPNMDPAGGGPPSVTPTQVFGSAEHCTPFFTESILAGLLVTFLCLGIAMWGLMMLMDIRTHDKFDDPREKTLVITAID